MTGISESPNPHRLHRSRDHRMVAGVLSGIAHYFGFDVVPLRLAFVVACVIGLAGPLILGYLVLWAVTPQTPERRTFVDPEQERFWRAVSTKPRDTFQGLRHKFRELDLRLARMEGAVTSQEFELNRQFRELERG